MVIFTVFGHFHGEKHGRHVQSFRAFSLQDSCRTCSIMPIHTHTVLQSSDVHSITHDCTDACTCARVARSPPACSSHMRNCGLRTACFVRNRMLVYKHAPKTHIIIVVIGLVHASLRGTHEPLQSLFCRCCQIPRSQVLCVRLRVCACVRVCVCVCRVP